MQGYAVIQGIKQVGVPVMYSRLKEIAAIKKADEDEQSMQVDEESKNSSEV